MTIQNLIYFEIIILMAIVSILFAFYHIRNKNIRDVLDVQTMRPPVVWWVLAIITLLFWLFSIGASPYVHIRYPALTFPFIALLIGTLPAYLPQKIRAACIVILLTSCVIRSAMTPIETLYSKVDERFQKSEYVGLLWLQDNKAENIYHFWGLMNKLLPHQQYYYFTRTHFAGFPNPSPASELLNNNQIKNILNAVGMRDFAFTEVPNLDVLKHEAQNP